MYLILNNNQLEIEIAKTFFKRLKGLMFKKSIKKGILFPHCNSIHTFFMLSSIDVIALNENNQIIKIIPNLKPNKIIKIKYPNKKTSILELPPNTSHNLKINDYLGIIP